MKTVTNTELKIAYCSLTILPMSILSQPFAAARSEKMINMYQIFVCRLTRGDYEQRFCKDRREGITNKGAEKTDQKGSRTKVLIRQSASWQNKSGRKSVGHELHWAMKSNKDIRGRLNLAYIWIIDTNSHWTRKGLCSITMSLCYRTAAASSERLVTRTTLDKASWYAFNFWITPTKEPLTSNNIRI